MDEYDNLARQTWRECSRRMEQQGEWLELEKKHSMEKGEWKTSVVE